MSKDTKGIKKYIGDVRGIKVKNILYFKQRFVGKHGKKHCMKNIGRHWKGPIFFITTKGTKKDIMCHKC